MSQNPDPPACPGCGAELHDGDRFCWRCGAGMRQTFPADTPTHQLPAVSAGVLVLIAVLLVLLGSYVTCGEGGPQHAGPGLVLALLGALVCVYAGWQMAARG